MNTNKILSLTTSLLLATTLFASSANASCNTNKQSCSEQSCKSKKMKHKKHSIKQNAPLVKMFMKLDLSKEQRAQIKTLIQKSKADMPNPHTAFTQKSFDKKEYIKLLKQKKEQKLQRRGDLIEKAYKVLNAKQKKELKTMLDMKEIMKKQKHSRHCSHK